MNNEHELTSYHAYDDTGRYIGDTTLGFVIRGVGNNSADNYIFTSRRLTVSEFNALPFETELINPYGEIVLKSHALLNEDDSWHKAGWDGITIYGLNQ